MTTERDLSRITPASLMSHRERPFPMSPFISSVVRCSLLSTVRPAGLRPFTVRQVMPSSPQQLETFQDPVGRLSLATKGNTDKRQVFGRNRCDSFTIVHVVEGREKFFREQAERYAS